MSAESSEPASAEEQKEMEDKVISPEKAEEAKLKARYPHLGQKPGGSDFLRKRLQKGQKYFDSGDYNMAKAKMKNKQLPTAAPDKTEVTGDHIPTPQDLPQRKPSLVANPSVVNGTDMSGGRNRLVNLDIPLPQLLAALLYDYCDCKLLMSTNELNCEDCKESNTLVIHENAPQNQPVNLGEPVTLDITLKN